MWAPPLAARSAPHEQLNQTRSGSPANPVASAPQSRWSSYNFERPHHGYRVRGRPPASIVFGAKAAAR
jgi:hypothetical protein